MARRGKGYQGRMKQRSDLERDAQHDGDLNVLRDLCAAYDGGQTHFSLLKPSRCIRCLQKAAPRYSAGGNANFHRLRAKIVRPSSPRTLRW